MDLCINPSSRKYDGLEWGLVVVGHFLAFEPVTFGGGLWYTISKCGIATKFTASDLAKGATQTCLACRPRKVAKMQSILGAGYAPPSHRIPPPDLVQWVQSRWRAELILKTVTSNLRGSAVKEFDEGPPMDAIRAVIVRSGLGLDFGWTVNAQMAAPYGGGNTKPRVTFIRPGANNPAQKRLDFNVKCHDTEYRYEVSLHTGRSCDWPSVVAMLTKGAEDLNAENDKGPAPVNHVPKKLAAPPPFTSPPTSSPADVLKMDPARLESMKSGLDVLLNASREATAGAAMKAELKAKYDEIHARAKPLLDAVDAAVDVVKKAETHLVACVDVQGEAWQALEKAKTQFELTTNECKWSEDNFHAAKRAQTEAALAAVGPAEELQRARIELEEAERLDQERMSRIQQTPDLAALISALQGANK